MNSNVLIKEIPGYPSYYAYSDGRIWSKKTHKFLKLNNHNNGYLNVTLRVEGKSITRLVHRLIAITFLENPNNLPQVNHKDENKHNNSVENLEWCSNIYNSNYGNCQENKARAQRKPILCIETKTKYPSLTEAGRQTGINIRHISEVCNGKIKTAGGFHWKYI